MQDEFRFEVYKRRVHSSELVLLGTTRPLRPASDAQKLAVVDAHSKAELGWIRVKTKMHHKDKGSGAKA